MILIKSYFYRLGMVEDSGIDCSVLGPDSEDYRNNMELNIKSFLDLFYHNFSYISIF